jgi:hypothetical protein
MTKLKTRLGILAFAVWYSITLAGFTGCENPMARPASGARGYGTVTIDVGDNVTPAGRTVLPGTGGLSCRYTFTRGGESRNLTPSDGVVTLEYGWWMVDVKAYLGDTNDETNLVATGREYFTVDSESLTIKVALTAVYENGSGVFKFRLQVPDGVTGSGTLRPVYSSSSTISLSFQTAVDNGAALLYDETEAIPAGFYLLTLTLQNSAGEKAGRNEVVHIYKNLSTEYGTVSAPKVIRAEEFTDRPFYGYVEPVELADDVWADGRFITDGREQWFKFTATADAQHVYVTSNPSYYSPFNIYVQLYDSSGTALGDERYLSLSSMPFIIRMVTLGQVYYIRARAGENGGCRIKFNSVSTLSTDAASAQELTMNTWADAAGGGQWFKFTATVTGDQYIHSFSTSNDTLQIWAFHNSGLSIRNEFVGRGNTSISLPVRGGQVYYIWVNSDSTYRIAFNESATLSPDAYSAQELTEIIWAGGELPPTGGEQWFKLTATVTGNQYIHFVFGTLEGSFLSIQLYDSSGAAIGDLQNLPSWDTSFNRTVTIEQMYYIRVRQSYFTSSDPSRIPGGTYRIAFSTYNTRPPEAALARELVLNTWADGELPDRGTQWFKFTAASTGPYHISVNFVTLVQLYVQVYDSSRQVGSEIQLSSGERSTSLPVTTGQVYYIRVRPYPSDAGTYQIAVSPSSMLFPDAALVQALVENTWQAGDLSTSVEQWFKFTATASIQYFHVRGGTWSLPAASLCWQLYDSSGPLGGLGGWSSINSWDFIWDLTAGTEYYILVTFSSFYDDRGTYQIAFNTSQTAPP